MAMHRRRSPDFARFGQGIARGRHADMTSDHKVEQPEALKLRSITMRF